MENIKEVLDFYVKATLLKTTTGDIENYSVADAVFGSMILAIAFDSEYKEMDNLNNVLDMLFLKEFDKLNPDYQYSNFKNGKAMVNIIVESKSCETKDSHFAVKYRLLDLIFSKIIKNLNDNNEAINFNCYANNVLKLIGNNNALKNAEISKFYYLNYQLKNKLRKGYDKKHCNIKGERVETVSEHIIGTIALALGLQTTNDYHFDNIIKMLTIHEIGNTFIDDIAPEIKKEIEQKAMGNLSNKEELLKILLQFNEQHNDLETKLALYCDKIDADLQSIIYQENNCAFKSKKVQQILLYGPTTAFDIWY